MKDNRTIDFDFTILVPFYNEEENIARLEQRLSAYLPKCTVKACVLFVNDGSKDNGGRLVEEACTRHDDFFYLNLTPNTGLSGALKAGIANCQSRLVGYIDADLQTDPEDFDLLLPHTDDYECVIGIRAQRKDGFVKRASSKIANSWRRMMTHDAVTDTGCPLKVMQTEYAREIPMLKGMHRFIPACIQMIGGRVMEVPVHHHPRTAGKAKYNLANRLWAPFIDCFGWRWMKKRYKKNSVASTNL